MVRSSGERFQEEVGEAGLKRDLQLSYCETHMTKCDTP